jgi:chitin disaccharide deacetylase
MLILNADDWGRDLETTDKTLDCALAGGLSSASAMVWMEDSERAADLAKQHEVDTGLHLNLTTPLTQANCPLELKERLNKLAAILQRGTLSRAVYHPKLASTFDYVVRSQRDEYARLYGHEPDRIDGHHHMHLCANVLMSDLMPAGTIVRRHFSYQAGEKALRNRVFRQITDLVLRRRYRTVDHLFSLPPLETARLERIRVAGQTSIVEVETHPINADEYRFLAGGGIFEWAQGCRIARGFARALRTASEQGS